VDLEDGQVGGGVPAEDPGGELAAVGQSDGDRGGAVDDVVVGHDDAVGAEHEPAAGALLGPGLEDGADAEGLGLDRDHRGAGGGTGGWGGGKAGGGSWGGAGGVTGGPHVKSGPVSPALGCSAGHSVEGVSATAVSSCRAGVGSPPALLLQCRETRPKHRGNQGK